MKKLIRHHRSNQRHWVGDGFPVTTIFSYNDLAEVLSPFLLLDYVAPYEFEPTERLDRGVGEHPHRGFETVTIVYQGEVTHRDSSGGGGTIGTGDVQWMTAGAGIIHREFHSAAFAARGGNFQCVQLWVNLPAQLKMTPPAYQALTSDRIPQVSLGEGARARLFAGQFGEARGPAKTHSPMHVWDVRLDAGAHVTLPAGEGETTALFVLSGEILIDGEVIRSEGLAVLSREGEGAEVLAQTDAVLLYLNGAPLNEPIVGYGPFVMNTEAEIYQAFRDYDAGRFGTIRAKDITAESSVERKPEARS